MDPLKRGMDWHPIADRLRTQVRAHVETVYRKTSRALSQASGQAGDNLDSVALPLTLLRPLQGLDPRLGRLACRARHGSRDTGRCDAVV